MSRAELATHARLALRHHGKAESRYKDAFLQQHVTHLYGGRCFAYNDRYYWRLARQRLEPGFGYLSAEIADVFAQLGHSLRMRLKKTNGAERAGRDGRWKCIREELWPRALREHVAQRLRPRNESASGTTQCFAECRRDHVDFADNPEVFRRSATG